MAIGSAWRSKPVEHRVLVHQDEFSETWVEPLPPEPRDWLKVLTGRYTAKVYLRTYLTEAGLNVDWRSRPQEEHPLMRRFEP